MNRERHAGEVCPKCQGNVMPKGETLICFQCGKVLGYEERTAPNDGRPYAKERAKRNSPMTRVEMDTAEEMRKAGRSWEEIGAALGRKPETVRVRTENRRRKRDPEPG